MTGRDVHTYVSSSWLPPYRLTGVFYCVMAGLSLCFALLKADHGENVAETMRIVATTTKSGQNRGQSVRVEHPG